MAPSVARLIEFLKIPSVSTDPNRAADVRMAAEWVRNFMRESGIADARLIDREGCHPLVYGEWLGAPGKPTLLLYGHYDVQPADPVELWNSPPFEPEIRGQDLFARGACDDKGQVMILLETVRRCLERDGRLPLNLKILIEGEEETSGRHVEEFVAEQRELLACDGALICDTEMFAPGMPTLCTGLRGGVFGEIHVTGPAQDLHSGVYGGAAPNPLKALALIVSKLQAEDGVVRIPGFYEAVRAPAPEELGAWRALPFDEEEYRRREVGSNALVGELGYSVLERTWARPTFEVHGISGGFTGAGFKTVIPAKAIAKVSCRLVPDQDPEKIISALREAITKYSPAGVTASFELLGSSPASVVDPNHPLVAKAAEALESVSGKKTVYMRSGGSIPIVALFLRELGVPSILMGFGLPDDNLHAPNEKFHLPNFHFGIDAVERYFHLAGGETADGV